MSSIANLSQDGPLRSLWGLSSFRHLRTLDQKVNEDDMPRSYSTLTLDDAKHMLSAAEAKAASFGIAYNIAVVDAGGHLFGRLCVRTAGL